MDNQEQLDRLKKLKESMDEDAFARLNDADGGLAGILAAMTTTYAGRFKAPIASIELMEEVVGIDVLKTGESIALTDLYRMLYILDAGPAALREVIKSQEKLKLVNRLDGIDRERCIDEIAEAEADLTLTAAEYYRKNFADADHIALANDLIKAINDVYISFSNVQPKPETDVEKHTNVKKKPIEKAGLWQWLKRLGRCIESSRM